jgi:hypothetical protein
VCDSLPSRLWTSQAVWCCLRSSRHEDKVEAKIAWAGRGGLLEQLEWDNFKSSFDSSHIFQMHSLRQHSVPSSSPSSFPRGLSHLLRIEHPLRARLHRRGLDGRLGLDGYHRPVLAIFLVRDRRLSRLFHLDCGGQSFRKGSQISGKEHGMCPASFLAP